MTHKNFISLLIGLIVICSGCGKKIYSPRSISSLKKQRVDYEETQQAVTMRAKLFNNNDCREIFEDRVDRLSDILIIQLSIENNSNKVWNILNKNISLKQESFSGIYHRLCSPSHPFLWALGTFGVGAAIGLGCGLPAILCFGIPICSSSHIPSFALFLLLMSGIGNLSATLGTPIAFISESIAGTCRNANLSAFLHETMFSKCVAVAPGTLIDRLIFVNFQNYKRQFDITLAHTATAEKMIFHVNLPRPTT